MRLRKSIIFCESYVQLDNTIGIVGEVAANSSVVIIFAGTVSITKFLNEILQGYPHNIKIVCVENVSATWIKNVPAKFHFGVNRVLALFIRIFHMYVLRLRHLNKMSSGDIYFFCRYYNAETYFLMKNIIKFNNVHYIESRDYDDSVNIEKNSNISCKIKIKEIILRFFLGNQMRYIRFKHGSYAPEISENIFNMCKTYVGSAQRGAWLAERVNKLITKRLYPYKIIFYDYGYEIRRLVKNIGEYERVVKETLAKISQYCTKEEIGIKNHPTFQPSVELAEYGVIIPNYIPGEFLQGEDTLLVAIFSTCVYNAKCGVPISILNMIDFEDENLKKNFLNVAKQREGQGLNVRYPLSIQDFKREIDEYFGYQK